MAHGDSLAMTIAATQKSLDERLAAVFAPHRDPERPRDSFAATDTFLAATSRHLAAVQGVLLEEVRRSVPQPEALLAEYLEAARELEQSLSLVKARLYGEAHAIHLAWQALWTRVRTQLTTHNRLEIRMVDELIRLDDPNRVDGLARRLFDAEKRAPTRPHPLLPHTGRFSGVARRIWAVADRFWDTAEGRVIPDPVRPAPHTHDSLMAQYFVADPKFDDHASLLEHHHRHRHPDREPD